jgi:hypothetical protein
MADKTGKQFERLVADIQESLHSVAEVLPNQWLPDVYTGQRRQIDILLRLADGPTTILVMIEVRDHDRRVDSPYIEQVNDKRRAVRADKAIVVSRSGFTRPAVEKARHLSIQTLTYATAAAHDWGAWFRARSLVTVRMRYASATVTLFDAETGLTIRVADEAVEAVEQDDSSKVLLDARSTPAFSVADLVSRSIDAYVRAHPPELVKIVESGSPASPTESHLAFAGVTPPLFVRDQGGVLRRIGRVQVDAHLFADREKTPFEMMEYSDAQGGRPYLAIPTADVRTPSGEVLRLEIIAPGASDFIPKGTQVRFRSTRIGG